MAIAVIWCSVCGENKQRGRWSDGMWASDMCQECVDKMHDKILEEKAKQAISRGELGF